MSPVLPLCLAAGMLLGLLYFAGLWWNVCLLARGAGPGRMALVMAGRFLLLAGALALASRAGAPALLALAAGVLLARQMALRVAR